MSLEKKIRPIAIYLPQFHPIPENDEWWGKGFTEWTNVSKAQPLYKGHYQPDLPADLGFYDLRLEEAREAQAKMAMDNGIHGFCYYHYWFNGRRILERPFNEVFESGKPNFPFMLCWANENWTRRWDGEDHEILLKQNYSDDDDREHIKSLLPYFKDNRYIKINGKPVFAVYKSALLPDIKNTIKIWREEARKEGIELYLCRFETMDQYGKSYLECGFDAAIEFQPFSKKLYEYLDILKTNIPKKSLVTKLIVKFLGLLKSNKIEFINSRYSINNYMDYNEFVDYAINSYKKTYDYTLFPGATPAWDNTARRGSKAFFFKNSSPSKFKKWLSFLALNYEPPTREENLLFINAWNEWAEGCHLEPCQKWGTQNLQGVKDVFVNNE